MEENCRKQIRKLFPRPGGEERGLVWARPEGGCLQSAVSDEQDERGRGGEPEAAH